MKLFKRVMMGVAVVVFVVSFAGLSSADWGHNKMKHESDIKTLKDSAAALQTTHPDLAEELTEIAIRKEKMLNKQRTSHEAVRVTVKESAAVLQQSNPDLSKRLTEYADMEMKETEGMEMKEADEHTVQLFREAATALKVSSPALATKLEIAANKKEMRMKCPMMDEKEMESKAGEKAIQ